MEASLQKKSYKELTVVSILLLIIACNNESEANELNSLFYNKFNTRLYKYCRIVAYKTYGHTNEWEFMAEEIYQETFISAFEQIKSVRFDETWSDEIATKKITGWLCRIAKNKMMDYIQGRTTEKEQFESYKEFVILKLDKGKTFTREVKVNYDKIKIENVFKSFKPIQMDVALLCAQYDCIGKDGVPNKKHLPDDVIKNLCEKYNTNSTNLRKIKERVLAKLAECRLNELA